MTISSTVRKAGPYVGAGTTATFAFAFKVFADTDVEVAEVDSLGTVTTLALTSGYTVSLNGDQDSSPGGTITLVGGNLPVGAELVITSSVAELQGTDLQNGGGFFPDTINTSLDKLTILVQQLHEQSDRSIKFPVTDTSDVVMPAAVVRAGKVLGFGLDGSLIAVDTVPSEPTTLVGVLYAGPGSAPTIDTQINAFGSNPGVVIIAATYTGPESSRIVNLSNGYKVWVGQANVNVIDLRNQQGSAGSPGNTPLYPLVYRGRLSGQITGLGINYASTGVLPDSLAAIAGFNWLNNVTLPTNNGAQVGGVFVTETTGSLVIGASTAAIVAVDGEAYADNTSTDGVLPAIVGVYGCAGISRTNSVQPITKAASLRAGTVLNLSTAGATIQDAYGLEAFNQNAGTRRNYGIYSAGSMLLERNFGIDVVLADASTHRLLQTLSSNNSVNISSFDATGGVRIKKSDASTDALVITDTVVTSSLPLKSGGDVTPIVAAGASAGNTSLPFAGVFVGNAAGNTGEITGTFTGNRVATLPDANVTLVGRTAATSQKAEIAADAALLTFTPPAAAGLYRITFALSLSAANAAVLGWTITYKDSNANAQSPTNLSLIQQGTAAPALTFTTSAAGNYHAEAIVDVDNSATNIVVKLTFSGTSFAGKASATIERLN